MANVVQAWPSDATVVDVVGEGADQLPTGTDNEVYRALSLVYRAHGQEPPPLRLRCENLIPPSRGLGSSSAARASGLLLGNRLLGDHLDSEALFVLGAELEGHPDNIAACLFGGVQVCVTLESGLAHCRVPVSFPVAATVFVPDFPMDTNAARGLLPTAIPVETAVHNIGRASLLVTALASGRPDLLKTATEDAIHQPPRSIVFPSLPALIEGALEAGAYGAFLSGAGSSVLALVDPEQAETVGAAMAAVGKREQVPGRVIQSSISSLGAAVDHDEEAN
jgi:homoserine kinase